MTSPIKRYTHKKDVPCDQISELHYAYSGIRLDGSRWNGVANEKKTDRGMVCFCRASTRIQAGTGGKFGVGKKEEIYEIEFHFS